MGENGKEANGGDSHKQVKENGGATNNGILEVDGREMEDTKDKHLGWKVMPFIIGNETFEKLGAIGTLANLLIYLTTVFNMENVAAATIITVFNGTCNLGTLFGAYFSDSFFGRYTTLGFATVASFLGLLMIDLTATVSKLHPPHCGKESKSCKGATPAQLAVLYAGFGLMVIGAGGVRPCNLAFGADQFNPKTESGKKGIASFFNWYFFTFTFAELVSLTLIVYVQSNVSWAIGLGIPAALMFIACVLYFVGSKLYVKVKATGSPFTSVAQVFVVATKKRSLQPLDQPWLSLYKYIPPESINARLAYTGQFKFLDKAAIQTEQDQINPDGSPADPWRLCSLQQVEEVKCLLKVVPIWIAAVLYYVPIVQQSTYCVFQATQSDRRLGSSGFKIPAASYTVFLMLGLTVFIPIYDRAMVPLFRRLTGQEQGITLLQRIGVGTFLSALSAIVSGFVENRRRAVALTRPTLGMVPRKGAISSMSAMWLVPQLVIAGLAEAFGSVGLMEFYYRQFPENMRTIAGSLFYCGLAGSNYFSSFLISIVHRITRRSSDWLGEDLNKGKLDYFYYLTAALGILNLGYFLMCAKWYRYKLAENAETEEDLTESEKHMADNMVC